MFAVLSLATAIVLLGAYFVSRHVVTSRRATYPLRYAQEILTYSGQYSLDPALVAAVVYCESTFNPQAVSGVDARGLMQIMEETGAWISGKLSERDYTQDRLFEPELNVRYGCWLLRFLLDRYDGNIENTIAAYHAGWGKVDGWLADKAYSEDGKTLTLMPDDSPRTRAYVNKVVDAYAQYKKIYAQGGFVETRADAGARRVAV